MAIIKIRGRADHILIEDSRAQKIKDRKFGDHGMAKAEPNELVDLGEWSGEYGRIIEIEIGKADKKEDDWRSAERLKQKETDERLLARSPEIKGKELGWFKLCASSRTGDYKWEPSAEVAEQAIVLQTKYFAAHPRAYTVPSAAYGDLLPRKKGDLKPLSVQKRVSFDEVVYPHA